jgi:Xaa-Pro aminopeptidase
MITLQTKNIQKSIQEMGVEACLISTNVNLYYCLKQIYTGYFYIPARGIPLSFVKSGNFAGDNIFSIQKPEEMPEILKKLDYRIPKHILFELGETPYLEIERLKSVFNVEACGDATSLLRTLRMYKLSEEIRQFRISSEKHIAAYKDIPEIFQLGMTDLDFQCEMEYVMRKHGSMGVIRVFGSNMDIFAGSILAGENAGAISPFDFALGGEGAHKSLPIGANGTKLEKGMSLMVDMGGCFTPYISDITRTFSIGKLDDLAYKAHQVSIEMHDYLRNDVKLECPCAEIYNKCVKTAEKYGLSEYFMGTKHQSKFVGHGTGLQLNELPILSPRSKDVIEENMVFAFEPKFVIPNVGAVGIENTYLVTNSGIENLSVIEEEMKEL